MSRDPTWQVFRFEDIIARLPPIARAKYRALVALADDVAALITNSHERVKALENVVIESEHALSRLDPKVDGKAIKRRSEELSLARADLEKLTSERAKRNALKANCDQVIGQLQNWINAWELGTVGVGPLRAARVNAIPAEGETLPDAIRRVRSEIGRVNAEIGMVRAAPPTAAEAKAAIIAEVDRMAGFGAPRLELAAGKATVQWPDVIPFAAPGQALAAPSGSASQLLCWLFRDQVVALLTGGLGQLKGGINQADRAARIAELEAQLIGLEHEEEAFVVQALAAGLECHRRPSANPLALLGIEVMPAAVAPALVAAE